MILVVGRVYFLKNKSEAFDEFVEFKALAKKECGQYVKVLRLDRGGEYTSNMLVIFCRKKWHKKRAYNELFSTTKWSGGEKKKDHY